MIYSVRDTGSVKLLVVVLRFGGSIVHWWLYCPLVVVLCIGGCIVHWWMYCALVDVLHIGFRTDTGCLILHWVMGVSLILYWFNIVFNIGLSITVFMYCININNGTEGITGVRVNHYIICTSKLKFYQCSCYYYYYCCYG